MSGCLPERSGLDGRGLRAGGEGSEHPDTEAADLDAAWYGSGDDVAPEQVGEHGSGERDPGDRAASRGDVDERSFLLVGQRRQVVSTGVCRPKAIDLVHEGSSLIAGIACPSVTLPSRPVMSMTVGCSIHPSVGRNSATCGNPTNRKSVADAYSAYRRSPSSRTSGRCQTGRSRTACSSFKSLVVRAKLLCSSSPPASDAILHASGISLSRAKALAW